MIIGSALGRLFKGFNVYVDNECVNVQNNYGNQDALDKFIALCDKESVNKFPLLFYVTNPVKDLGGYKYCDTTLIIMTNTNPNWLSKDRTFNIYDKVIEPIYRKLVTLLSTSQWVSDMSMNKIDRFSYLDVPNFGLLESQGVNAAREHNNVGRKKSQASVITDYVDARIVNLKLRIKTNCIK